MIVDDHAMVRRGLRFFLKGFEDLELVAEASEGREAVELCAEANPDVILMDMVMPDMYSAAATLQVRKQDPDVKVNSCTRRPWRLAPMRLSASPTRQSGWWLFYTPGEGTNFR
jgi:DNA-binding NarL/FixJ family response regulator